MYDWQKVEGATLFPYHCVSCLNQRDVLDTNVDLPQWGHVYVCKVCARTSARIFGFSKGKEQDKLANAAEVVEELEKLVEETNGERKRLGDELIKAELHNDSLMKENAQLKGRVAQLQSRIADEARAALELVGGDAA